MDNDLVNVPRPQSGKRIYCIEVQERGKNFALIIKSSLFGRIFIDVKGVNCASLEIVLAKKYFI